MQSRIVAMPRAVARRASIPGRLGPNQANHTKAGWTVRYWLSYRCAEDGQTFFIHLRRDIDIGEVIEGGVRRDPKWVAGE
jgi:hypothetical protein